MSEQQPSSQSASQSASLSALQPTAQPTSSAVSSETPKPDRKHFVQALIGLSAFLFLCTSAILYYRWATTREPSCELTVMASQAYRGAIIKVDGPMLPKAHKLTIGEDDRYTLAFFLDPGSYDVTVTLNGQSQYTGTCVLDKMAVGTLDLTHTTPTTQPIAGPLAPPPDEVVTPAM